MKKNYFISMLAGALMMVSTPASAQYITEAPAGGFDFSKGKDYVVLYAPDDIITQIADKTASNQTLDATQTNNALYYWINQWDSHDTSLCNVPHPDKKNSFGTEAYQSITPSGCWGGNGTAAFTPTGKPYDFSMIDNDYILHIGIMNNGAKDATFKITIGSTATINESGFQLTLAKEVGAEDGNFVGVGKLPRDSKWYNLDIPIADLVDDNGVFGFAYDFSNPITDAAITVAVSNGTASKTTHALADPDDAVYTYTITELGSVFSFDSFFFYKKSSGTDGIKELKVADAENGQTYNLNGQRVGNGHKGIAIVNGKKVVVK